ncbi:MAG: LysR substrate-binding domain-containing protein [Polyangiales bacterium]
MPPSADHIATFVEVVRQHSLSAAARSLGLPKSTVSRRLMRLERALESKLLQRTPRRVALTSAGRDFYASVVTAVDALADAARVFEQSRREPRGVIRFTAPPDLGRMVLAPMLVAFLERYPDIELDVVLSNQVLDLAEEGIDLAVRAAKSLDSFLVARRLCTAAHQLAASPKLATRLADTRDVRSLERQAFVLHRQRPRSVTLERSGAGRAKRVALAQQGRLRVDDYAAMAELVSHGHGIGLMPAIHVRAGSEAGRLVRVLPEWSEPAGHVYLVYPARQHAERVRLLSDFLLTAFGQLESV